MFRHLLVPLDGSKLAEAALPAAAGLARLLGARVTLVHVIERDAPQEIHGERHLSDPDEARGYLEDVAARAFPCGLRVEIHVHAAEVSNVPRSIVEHVGELGPDLIVMCTHGRGGLRGWMFGRIAQQVVNLGATPVLLVQPGGMPKTGAFSCRRLLVALDGDAEHEQGLATAADLAGVCGAELRLVMVVPTFSRLSGREAATARMLPGSTYAVLNMAEKDAKAYLQRHATRLRHAGFPVTAEVRRGDPVDNILDAAIKSDADLIVLATHGKTAMDAFWSGSATPGVAGRATVSLLMVPVGRPE